METLAGERPTTRMVSEGDLRSGALLVYRPE